MSTDIGSPLRLQPGAWIARNWWVVLAGLALGIAAAFGYLSVAPETYASTATLRVEEVLDVSIPSAQVRFEEINMDDEAQLLRSDAVAQRAAELMSERLERDVSTSGLLNKLALRVPPNTEVFSITFTAGDPRTAQAGAQAFADAYVEDRTAATADEIAAVVASLADQRNRLVAQLAQATARVDAAEPGTSERTLAEAEREFISTQIAQINSQILPFQGDPEPGGTVLDEAPLPTSPASPQPLLVLGSGAVLGLLLGSAVALGRQGVQRVVRAPDDVEARLGLRTLGHITELSGLDAVSLERGAGRTEYDRVRNVVLSSLRATDSVVVVASPQVRPVTGAVAANLAAALGRSGSNVAVLDLTSDGIAEALLDADNGFGFRDLFQNKLRLEALLCFTRVENVTVVRSGRIDVDPDIAGRLASATVEELFTSLRNRFDFVLVAVDSSLGDGSAPQSIALAADAAVVVAELNQTAFADLQALVRSIEDVGTTVHGSVVTRGVRSPLPFNAVRSRRLGADRQLEPPRPPARSDELQPAARPADDGPGLVTDPAAPPFSPAVDDDEPVEAELMDEVDEPAHVAEPEPVTVVEPEPVAEEPEPVEEPEPAVEEPEPVVEDPDPGPVAEAPHGDIVEEDAEEEIDVESTSAEGRDVVADDALHAPSGRWALTDSGLVRVETLRDQAGEGRA